MTKKNTKLIKSALKELNTGKVRLCANELKKGQNYCAVGFLAAFAAKKEPKKTAKALDALGTFTEYGDYDSQTGTLAPNVERRWTLSDLFDSDSENSVQAIEVCARVYGITTDRLNAIVSLNDETIAKLSRVERLRLALQHTLDNKKSSLTEAVEAALNS